MQNKFLYFPNDDCPTKRCWRQKPGAVAGDRCGLPGLDFLSVTRPPGGTIVLFHGNGGTAFDRNFY